MKRTGKCPKCGSSDIIADAKAIDYGNQGVELDLSVATIAKPNAWLFRGKRETTMSAWVCADCGYVELYADHPQRLKTPAAET